MTSFTTRVELHDATREDYFKLHEKMSAQGFSTTVKASDGHTYQLPPAEYNFVGTATKEDVLERAKKAAAAVKSSNAVLVTESNGRTWHNLPTVKTYA